MTQVQDVTLVSPFVPLVLQALLKERCATKHLATLLNANSKLSRNMNQQIHEEVEVMKDVPYQKCNH